MSVNDVCAGEVVEANTARFVAQCHASRLHEPPGFGTFVKVLPPGALPIPPAELFSDPFADIPTAPALPEGAQFALVYFAETASQEPGRHASAFGLDEQRLREEQPQIFDLLCTRFQALHIGHIEAGRFRFGLPPRPPRLHAFVYECSPEESRALADSPDLLRFLLRAPGDVPVDDLIAATLRLAAEKQPDPFAFLVRSGRALATLLRDAPDRLTSLLRQIEP